MSEEAPNNLHLWIMYKSKWVCNDCGCCSEEDCNRCEKYKWQETCKKDK